MTGAANAFKAIVAAGVCGLIFGAGLIVGGMTQPSKVIGFLDIAGAWDPSLAFVMGGAIGVFLPLFRLIQKRRAPVYALRFTLPTRRDVDAPLLLGAALFGVGWGLVGYCPGPAFTTLAAPESSLMVVLSVFAGFGLKRSWDRRPRRCGSSTVAAR